MATQSLDSLSRTTGPTTTIQNGAWWILAVAFIILAIYLFIQWWQKRTKLVKDVADARKLVFLRLSVPKKQHVEDAEERDYRIALGAIEPFLSTLAGVEQRNSKQKPRLSLEIISKNGEIFFYIACQPELVEMIERQLHSQYPAAQIERAQDFKLFDGTDQPYDAASLKLDKDYILPIKTYRSIEVDPLNGITNALSKLDEKARGAVQIVVRPTARPWQKQISAAQKKLSSGEDIKSDTAWDKVGTLARDVAGQASGKINQNVDEPKTASSYHQGIMELLKIKTGKQALDVEIRCAVTAQEEATAQSYLNTLLSAFSQFSLPDGNGFKVTKKPADAVIREYLLRSIGTNSMLLNTEELASIYHLPNQFTDTPNIHWLSSRKLAPPANLPHEGIKMGESVYRGQTREINLLPNDRLRHTYTIGKTGVGKTVMFENMIEQDIKAGHGVAYLDPNGDAIEWILSRIPKSRAEDVIYFNPSDMARPFGLNLLEWKRPEDRDFLVQESISIFYKLFDPGKTGIVGPQFEHWFRNAALTLMADPNGGTLVDIPRLFIDKAFEIQKVAHVKDPVVRSFWEKQMAQTSPQSKSEMLNYFISKFGRFMTNDMMRNIIGQTKSSFDFRDVMDNRKILLVNLSKGLIGDINAQLLGMILVSKLQMAAFSRQDIPEEKRIPFYLYVDEFQNFTTDSFATILSEARKYKLGLHITNQYIAQLEESIRNAVVGNVGTMMAFRVGAADAEFLINEFDGLTIEDMVNTEKQHFYIKMLIDNAPTKSFTGRSSEWTPEGSQELSAAIKELSRLKHGRNGEEVNAEILQRSRIDQIPIPSSKEREPIN